LPLRQGSYHYLHGRKRLLKRLLLLTYYYPPKPAAGSLRPFYLSKYLIEHGWATTVVTPVVLNPNADPHAGSWSIRARQRLATLTPQFAKRAFHSFVCFPDDAIFWLPSALRQASQALKLERYDAVMSSAMPASMHIAGAFVRRRHGLPWLADYRDLWTSNPYQELGPIRRALEHRLEARLLREATAITAVSDAFVRPMQTLAPNLPVYTIPNAVDLADWQGIANPYPTEFRLTYGGQLYDGRRSPETLFAALASLRRRGEAAGNLAKVDFYGADLRMIPPMAERYGLSSIVTLHGLVDRNEMLRAQRDSAVLLVLLRSDKATAGEYGSKIFEYIGAKRHVLAIGGAESVVKSLINASALGFFASDVEHCQSAIRELYARYSSGHVEPVLESTFQPFTAPQLASRFAEVLNVMVARPS